MRLIATLALVIASLGYAGASFAAKTTKEARMECLKEHPTLKGKELKTCIDQKQHS